jgi:lipid-binding SYLF domain-containing protein
MSGEEKPEDTTKVDDEVITKKSLALAQVRPSRLSMEGYIYNAHAALQSALDPKSKEVSVELMDKCVGIVIITTVHVGAIVSLYYGTGVLLKKTTEGGWSPPAAIAVGGTSFGAVIGGKRDNSLIFIMDEETLLDFCKRPQSRIGVDAYVFVRSMLLEYFEFVLFCMAAVRFAWLS